MNPLAWKHEHQLALLLGALIGIVVALVAGLIYHSPHYYGPYGQLVWSYSGFRWDVLGALVGSGVIYESVVGGPHAVAHDLPQRRGPIWRQSFSIK
jgi:hypothetical protein